MAAMVQEQTLKEQTLLELKKTKREYDQVYQQVQMEREGTKRELAHARMDADAAMEARAVAIRQREVALKEVAEIRLEREMIRLEREMKLRQPHFEPLTHSVSTSPDLPRR